MQVFAKIQKREARATRSIARARESCSPGFWIRSIALSNPPPSPHTLHGNRGTEQRGRASGRRLIRINAVAHHSRVSFFCGYHEHDVEQKLAFNQIDQWSVFFTIEGIKFHK